VKDVFMALITGVLFAGLLFLALSGIPDSSKSACPLTAYEQVVLQTPTDGVCLDAQHLHDWAGHEMQPLIEEGYRVTVVKIDGEHLVVGLEHPSRQPRSFMSEFATIPCPEKINPFF